MAQMKPARRKFMVTLARALRDMDSPAHAPLNQRVRNRKVSS